jgi:uncharacterized membrane protein SpoIIM required for sporulation
VTSSKTETPSGATQKTPGLVLKSAEFRREREATWQELESVIERVERGGSDVLAPREMARLPVLYRATLSSLSVAKSISLDRNVVDYLEALSARAFLCVYAERMSLGAAIQRFFVSGFPASVRAAQWHVLFAAGIFIGGIVWGLLLTLNQPDYFYTLMPDALSQGRSPSASTAELRAVLYDRPALSETLTAFAAFLFTHNTLVGFLAFALGIVFGLPTAILLLYNGLMVGALGALYESRGLGIEFWGWISIHGMTEQLAILLCGGAGFSLAGAVIFPGRHSRLTNLAERGRQAAVMILGAMILFLIAALLEGFGRQLVFDTDARFGIGIGVFVALCLYLGLSGRSNDGTRAAATS